MAAKAHKDEHRDGYIAAIVAGIIIILILLYLYGGQSGVVESAANQPNLPNVDGSATPNLGDYNYNITPYDPGTPIQYAFPSLYPSTTQTGCGCNDNGLSPCSQLGGIFGLSVAQYESLVT